MCACVRARESAREGRRYRFPPKIPEVRAAEHSPEQTDEPRELLSVTYSQLPDDAVARRGGRPHRHPGS